MGTAAPPYHDAARDLIRDDLIIRHLDFVRRILARTVLTLPEGIDTENLESAGILGLVEAAQQFDSGRGAPFKTFAYPRIRGAIIDELRRNCPLPQQMLQAIAQVRRACESLEPPVTPEALAEATGLTLKEVDDCLAAIRLTRIGVWCEVKHGVHVARCIDAEGPEADCELEESKQILADCIQQLPDQERTVVELYYLQGLRLKQIGKVFGFSESRVSRILTKAEFRLRNYVKAKTN